MKFKDIEIAATYKKDIAKIKGMKLMQRDCWDQAPSQDLMLQCMGALIELRNNTSSAKDGKLDTVRVCGVTLNHWEAQQLADALAETFSEILLNRENALRDMLPQEPEDEWKYADDED